jgi:hypothetical protein
MITSFGNPNHWTNDAKNETKYNTVYFTYVIEVNS